MNSRAKGGQVIERSNQITWYLSTATNLKFWRRLFPVPEMQLVVGGDDEKLLDGVEGEAGNDALHTPHLRPTIQVPDPHLPAQTAACYHSLVYIDWWFSTKNKDRYMEMGTDFLELFPIIFVISPFFTKDKQYCFCDEKKTKTCLPLFDLRTY